MNDNKKYPPSYSNDAAVTSEMQETPRTEFSQLTSEYSRQMVDEYASSRSDSQISGATPKDDKLIPSGRRPYVVLDYKPHLFGLSVWQGVIVCHLVSAAICTFAFVVDPTLRGLNMAGENMDHLFSFQHIGFIISLGYAIANFIAAVLGYVLVFLFSKRVSGRYILLHLAAAGSCLVNLTGLVLTAYMLSVLTRYENNIFYSRGRNFLPPWASPFVPTVLAQQSGQIAFVLKHKLALIALFLLSGLNVPLTIKSSLVSKKFQRAGDFVFVYISGMLLVMGTLIACMEFPYMIRILTILVFVFSLAWLLLPILIVRRQSVARTTILLIATSITAGFGCLVCVYANVLHSKYRFPPFLPPLGEFRMFYSPAIGSHGEFLMLVLQALGAGLVGFCIPAFVYAFNDPDFEKVVYEVGDDFIWDHPLPRGNYENDGTYVLKRRHRMYAKAHASSFNKHDVTLPSANQQTQNQKFTTYAKSVAGTKDSYPRLRL